MHANGVYAHYAFVHSILTTSSISGQYVQIKSRVNVERPLHADDTNKLCLQIPLDFCMPLCCGLKALLLFVFQLSSDAFFQ